MTDEERLAYEQAEETLSRMAFALLSEAPELLQIILPARRQEETRSRVEESIHAVVVVDEDGVVTAFDDAAQRLFDRTEAEAVGQHVSAFLVAEGAPPLTVVERRAGAKVLQVSPDLLGARPNGARFPLEVQHSALRLAGRTHFVLRLHDLVELQRSNEPIRQAEARYRALVEQIPAVTFMAALDDQAANEMYVSPQIELLLGFSQKEWLDDPILWFKQLHPDDQNLWNQEFSRGIASGGPFRAECRVFTRDRRLVWIHGEARLVRDDQGKPLFLQGIAFDITESKRAIEQQREAQDTKIKSERLSAIGQLAASIGHDIRNPIAAVRNATHYLQRRVAKSDLASDARVNQSIAIMDKELNACAKIVGDLLDYARERAPALVRCPLKELVDDAVGVIALPSHVTVENVVDDDVAPPLDRDQFRQVLVNLIQNAAEAIPSGRAGVVRVAAESTPDWTTITVEDNGTGIPEEDLKKVFEPLFTSKLKGTGLGLSIVANAVKRHKGTLDVASRRDAGAQGTTFTLRLPSAPTGAVGPGSARGA